MTTSRSITIRPLSRVEGQGGLRLRLERDRLDVAEFNIYEPPRFFARLLVGRGIAEVPDITARICGICPAAYQLSSCMALEKAVGIDVGPDIMRLRRLLACGEWISSHALHLHLLHAPDFFGSESIFSLPPARRGFVERGLRLKALGSSIMEAIGGRAVHPINMAVGGFHRSPTVAEIRGLVPELTWGLEAACAVVEEVDRFDFPDLPQPSAGLCLMADREYPMNDGRVSLLPTTGSERSFPIERFEDEIYEFQVPHSTALHVRLTDGTGPYRCGPLARINRCLELLPPRTRRAASACTIHWPTTNTFHSIVARGVEMAAACEEALAIAADFRAPLSPARLPFTPRPSVACHATEAPRGLLYHRYEIGENGLIAAARLIPPTSQNQRQIEADLVDAVARELAATPDADDAKLAHRCERIIRNYDPCISCATHFLRFELMRQSV